MKNWWNRLACPLFEKLQFFELKNITVEYTPGMAGDICHRNIKGLSNNRAKKYFKNNCKKEYLSICRGDTEGKFDSSFIRAAA